MIAQIEVMDNLTLKYHTVGYIELDSNDIDRYNNLTFIGLVKVRSKYDVPDDIIEIFPDAYKVNILTEEGLIKAKTNMPSVYSNILEI